MRLDVSDYSVAVWHSSNGVRLLHSNEFTLLTVSQVSTGMGDHLWVGVPSQYVTIHPGQLSLLPSVG